MFIQNVYTVDQVNKSYVAVCLYRIYHLSHVEMLQSVVSTCLALLKEGVQNQPNGKYGIEMAFHNNFFLRIDFFEYFEFFLLLSHGFCCCYYQNLLEIESIESFQRMLTDSSSPLCSCQIKTVSECEIRFGSAFLARNYQKGADTGRCHSIRRHEKCGFKAVKSHRMSYQETNIPFDHPSTTNFHILIVKRNRTRIRAEKYFLRDISMVWFKERGIT